ncbi:MAG: Bacteriorhodopsin-like protein [uncultured Sphingomonadaceae bacterium]|uniref:Bacteriorhodopsin-like protein n=1 Tax=uncultured Sphingomonadaceae bacterium TaxID=169976 RepID=A0A6J4SS55_9SPHN|nr:MAG: Bacteriorhodopsin-like protein [uncultured Sphingomonadaceae bacterium]
MTPKPLDPDVALWLWLGVAGMVLSALVLFPRTRKARTPYEESELVNQFFVLLIASGTYLAMALGQGSVIAGDGRQVQVSRYMTWAFTTPLLLLGLASTALGSPIARRKPVVAGLIGADVIMIVTGLVAALSPQGSAQKWIWFTVSSGAFLAVLAILWTTLRAESRATGDDHHRLFLRNNSALSVIWLLYPLNFVFGTEGLGLYGQAPTTAGYTLLDLLSKPIYGFFALAGVKRLVDGRAGGAPTLNP